MKIKTIVYCYCHSFSWFNNNILLSCILCFADETHLKLTLHNYVTLNNIGREISIIVGRTVCGINSVFSVENIIITQYLSYGTYPSLICHSMAEAVSRSPAASVCNLDPILDAKPLRNNM